MKKGFTLIELLTVIAIIAILAGLIFPVFSTAREKARQANCLSNLKNIGMAVMLYVSDHHETYPLSYTGNPYVTDAHLPAILNIYVNDYRVWYCPSGISSYNGQLTDDEQRIAATTGGYGANGYLMGYMDVVNFPACAKAVKTTRVKSPSNVIALMDFGTFWFQPNLITEWHGYGGVYLPGTGLSGLEADATLTDGDKVADYKDGRHSGGVNICYADGHVDYEKSSTVLEWVNLAAKNPFIPSSW